MTIKKHYIFFALVLILGIVFVVREFCIEEVKPKKILFISSYHKSFSWVQSIEAGVKETFKKKRIPIIYESFYMDTKRKSKKVEVLESAKNARDLIESWSPDGVIVSDDNAVKYVVSKMLNTKYKFSFCGVNNEPEDYGLPAFNVTGVLERHRFIDTMKIVRIIAPKVKRIAVLSEKSPSSDLILKQFFKKVDDLPVKVTCVHQSNSFDDWKKVINKYKKNTDAFLIVLYFSIKDNQGNSVDSEKIVKWITDNSNLPEVSFFGFFVKDGGLMSDAVDSYSQGAKAAGKLIKMLKNPDSKPPPIEVTTDGIIYINAQRAKALNLIIPSDLVEGSNIIW